MAKRRANPQDNAATFADPPVSEARQAPRGGVGRPAASIVPDRLLLRVAGGGPYGVDISTAISTQMLIGFHSRIVAGNLTVTGEIPPAQEREPV